MFKMSMCFMFYLMIYFSIVGGLTVLESKILAAIQLSSSVCSIGVLGIYHFFLDFLKMVLKGFFMKNPYKLLHISLFLCYLLILSFSMLVLPVNCFSIWFYYSILIYIFMDSSFTFFKIILLNSFNFKFVNFSIFKMKSLYVFGEGLFLFFYFKIFILFSFFGVVFLNKVLIIFKCKVGLLLIVFILFSLFFLMVLFKFFSTPFDYIEVESEFVGGILMELAGVLFVIWSLLEYTIIFNNVVFLISMFTFVFFTSNFTTLMIGVLILLLMVFLFSGILVSVSFISMFFFLVKIYCLFIFFLTLIMIWVLTLNLIDCFNFMYGFSWLSLGCVNYNYMQFLSLGNNSFLMWLVFMWLGVFAKYFLFSSGIKKYNSFKTLMYNGDFFMYSVYFIKMSSEMIENFFYYLKMKMLMEFYEYYSIFCPFLGIIISLSLNFLLLAMSSSGFLGVSCMVIFVASQWGWKVIWVLFSVMFKLFKGVLMEGFDIFYGFSSTLLKDLGNYLEFFDNGFGKILEGATNKLNLDVSMDICLTSLPILYNLSCVFYVTSTDVIHSLGVPSLGVKLDGVPGFFSGVLLELYGKSGETYEFTCYEYCGVNHTYMFGSLVLLNYSEFFFFLMKEKESY